MAVLISLQSNEDKKSALLSKLLTLNKIQYQCFVAMVIIHNDCLDAMKIQYGCNDGNPIWLPWKCIMTVYVCDVGAAMAIQFYCLVAMKIYGCLTKMVIKYAAVLLPWIIIYVSCCW